MPNVRSFYAPTEPLNDGGGQLEAYLSYLEGRNGLLEGRGSFAVRERAMERFDVNAVLRRRVMGWLKSWAQQAQR